MTTYDNWLGYWSDSGRKEAYINSTADYSNQKSPCHVEILSRDLGLEWHPNHWDVVETEMVVAGDSPKISSKFEVVD